LDVRWIHGSPSSKHDTDPEIQTFAYDSTTYILRQNKSVNYEAPFLFIFRGARRALLIDTGATADPRWFPLRTVVDGIVGDGELVVLHTHSHGDHVGGDAQFLDRPRTTVVGTSLEELTASLGLGRWPDGTAAVDLGDRMIEVIPSPGHDVAAVSYFDNVTGFLLTGDSVYPGRLYVRDWSAYVGTILRLVAFAEKHPVTYVVGCHIEMTGRRAVITRSGRPTSRMSHRLRCPSSNSTMCCERFRASMDEPGPTCSTTSSCSMAFPRNTSADPARPSEASPRGFLDAAHAAELPDQKERGTLEVHTQILFPLRGFAAVYHRADGDRAGARRSRSRASRRRRGAGCSVGPSAQGGLKRDVLSAERVPWNRGPVRLVAGVVLEDEPSAVVVVIHEAPAMAHVVVRVLAAELSDD
jgi:hydroxyacylglutathione hydrolase